MDKQRRVSNMGGKEPTYWVGHSFKQVMRGCVSANSIVLNNFGDFERFITVIFLAKLHRL